MSHINLQVSGKKKHPCDLWKKKEEKKERAGFKRSYFITVFHYQSGEKEKEKKEREGRKKIPLATITCVRHSFKRNGFSNISAVSVSILRFLCRQRNFPLTTIFTIPRWILENRKICDLKNKNERFLIKSETGLLGLIFIKLLRIMKFLKNKTFDIYSFINVNQSLNKFDISCPRILRQ